MKLKSQYAHNLVEQFIEWNRSKGAGPRGYRSAAPYMVPSRRRPLRLHRWFCDEHASLVDTLLADMERKRPEEYAVLMFYYFCGQSQAETAKRFSMHPAKIDTLVNAGIAYLDGQLNVLVA